MDNKNIIEQLAYIRILEDVLEEIIKENENESAGEE